MDTVIYTHTFWAEAGSGDELVAVFVRALNAAMAAAIGSRAYREICSPAKQSRVFTKRNFLGAMASHLLAPPRAA